MSMKNMRRQVPSLLKDGHKQYSGVQGVVLKNIEACKQLSKVTRTSLGPNGQNKMVINHLEKLFVTSDAATILREMDIMHPAAKMLVLAAQQQEREVGDGSNLVVVLCGELLKLAEVLIHGGVHPSEIISGYSAAYRHLTQILPTLTVPVTIDLNDSKSLQKGIYAAIASKQYGVEDVLAPLVADACSMVMPKNPANFLVENVRVCKILGQSVQDSHVIKGVVIDRDTEGLLKKAENVRVAVFSCYLEATDTETKGTVLISNAEELLKYSTSEETMMETYIKKIVDCGVGAVIVSSTISALAMHFLEKYKILAVKLMSKFELRRIAKCVGAKLIAQPNAFGPEDMGFCASIHVEEVGARRVTVLRQSMKETGVATIVVRGSTQNILNDIERAIDDGVNCVRAMGRDARVLPGAGAVEIELAKQLGAIAEKCPGLEQYAMRKFADALEVVPRTLSENAGFNPTDILASLYAAHQEGNANVGVNIEQAGIKDMTGAGILDLYATKEQAYRLASDTAITILRIDQIIMAKAAGGPKAPQQNGNWDED